MRKALELTVYPQGGFGYRVPLRVWSPASCDPEDDFEVSVSENDVQARIESKRLTDAELAAELLSAIFHEAECEVRGRRIEQTWPAHPAVERYAAQNREFGRQAGILERFATLPHYDSESDA